MYIFFLFLNIPKDVLKALVKVGKKNLQKNIEYFAIFPEKEVFSQTWFFETQSNDFMIGKNSDILNSGYSRKCLKNSSGGNRSNQEKRLSTL